MVFYLEKMKRNLDFFAAHLNNLTWKNEGLMLFDPLRKDIGHLEFCWLSDHHLLPEPSWTARSFGICWKAQAFELCRSGRISGKSLGDPTCANNGSCWAISEVFTANSAFWCWAVDINVAVVSDVFVYFNCWICWMLSLPMLNFFVLRFWPFQSCFIFVVELIPKGF